MTKKTFNFVNDAKDITKRMFDTANNFIFSYCKYLIFFKGPLELYFKFIYYSHYYSFLIAISRRKFKFCSYFKAKRFNVQRIMLHYHLNSINSYNINLLNKPIQKHVYKTNILFFQYIFINLTYFNHHLFHFIHNYTNYTYDWWIDLEE